MSRIVEFPGEIDALSKASEWVLRLEEGLTAAEQNELHGWLKASPTNRHVFLKAAESWDKLDSLSDLAELFPHTDVQSKHRRWLPAVVAASAAVFSVAIGAITWHTQERHVPPTAEVSVERPARFAGLHKTAMGEREEVELPDGTVLLLNTDTRVWVNYADEHRLLILVRGELHLDVAHDADRPLRVAAGQQIIQAVGTAFNVELFDDQDVELVVTEGTVLVGELMESPSLRPSLATVVLPAESMTVSAGEQIILDRSPQPQAVDIEPAVIDAKLSWQRGNLVFRGEPLEYAVAEISRYAPVEFVLLDDQTRSIPVVGRFKTGDVEGLLQALTDNFGVTYERQDGRILVKGG